MFLAKKKKKIKKIQYYIITFYTLIRYHNVGQEQLCLENPNEFLTFSDILTTKYLFLI
jgi:hypothetical protein